tara:strand:- start:1418 stop:1852 length:435 start_codon:yes stop_codon:yes gene_type:complete
MNELVIIKSLKDRFKHISTWRIITCDKCAGTGTIRAFKHRMGGVCFACKGKGFFKEKWSTYRARKKREEKKRREQEENQRKQIEKYDLLKKRYGFDDPRLGPEMRERMVKFESTAQEVWDLLDQWDSDPEWIKTRDHIRRNLSK